MQLRTAAFRYNLSVVFIPIDFLWHTLDRRHASASRHSLRPPTTPSARQNSFATSSAGTVKHVAGVIWLWLEWDTKGKALEDSTGKVWLLDKVSVHFHPFDNDSFSAALLLRCAILGDMRTALSSTLAHCTPHGYQQPSFRRNSRIHMHFENPKLFLIIRLFSHR